MKTKVRLPFGSKSGFDFNDLADQFDAITNMMANGFKFSRIHDRQGANVSTLK